MIKNHFDPQESMSFHCIYLKPNLLAKKEVFFIENLKRYNDTSNGLSRFLVGVSMTYLYRK